jgi:hypothetical protein
MCFHTLEALVDIVACIIQHTQREEEGKKKKEKKRKKKKKK